MRHCNNLYSQSSTMPAKSLRKSNKDTQQGGMVFRISVVALLLCGLVFALVWIWKQTETHSSSLRPSGSWPALEAQPGSYLGREVDLGNGLLAYVVQPPAATLDKASSTTRKKGLISFQDIYRYDTARCKGVADQFALAGYVVVHVDFVGTDEYSNDQNLLEWVKERSFADFIKPKLLSTVIPYLKNTHGVETIVATGFCWGSYLALQAAADSDVRDDITATAHFHPALKLNTAFDANDPECLEIAPLVSSPTLLVPAGNDPDFLGPNGSIMALLQKKNPDSRSVVMKDMKHGFVIRGDISDPLVKRDVQGALQLAIEFFDKHTSN
jgi:dienelactone hydrolase